MRNGDSITDADIAAALSQVTPDITRLYKGEYLKGSKGTYKLVNSIGHGAVGHVWSANYEEQSTMVAIKHANPRPDLLEPSMLKNIKRRFMREARHGMKLKHDALIRYLDVGRHKDSPFLVMELAVRSLDSLLKSEGPLKVNSASPIVARSVEALKYLHDMDCTHRDLKPANILECERGWVVSDLGIVKWSDLNPAFTSAATITRASIQLGSWHYMAPEQQADPHAVTSASDVYALGVTWYELLTGSMPPPAAFAAGAIAPPTKIPSLNELISRMTAYVPGARPTLDEVNATANAILI